jgi:signal transduction histidine kinase
MSPTRSLKMVLRCDQHGQVLQTTTYPRGFRAGESECSSLSMMVDRASTPKCERFLQRVRAFGAAFGWEMNVSVARETVSLLFAGLRQPDDQLLVAIASNHEDLLGALDYAFGEASAAGPSSEALGAFAESRAPPAPAGPNVLDELTRVNNDLVSLQRELAKRNAELTAITKQRNRLLATAAHDLRNPIMIVQGYCDLLGMTDSTAGGQNDLVEKLQRAAELMLHVIEDTLEFVSLESGKQNPRLQQVDLAALVQRTVASFRSMAEHKDIELVVSQSEPVPPLALDPSNIERVLGNLLSNAIKFSQRGSRVEAALTRRDSQAVLSVIDHGPGISEVEVPLLFRPFQTASARPTAGEPSTGLGLAIVRELVEANGGEVSVRSRLHEGSTFEVRFTIPRVNVGKLAQPADKPSREPQINVRRGRDPNPH